MSAKLGLLSIVCVQLGVEKGANYIQCLPLYGAEGCPLSRGCLSIEVNGRTVGIFRSVCYIVDVCYEVC